MSLGNLKLFKKNLIRRVILLFFITWKRVFSAVTRPLSFTVLSFFLFLLLSFFLRRFLPRWELFYIFKSQHFSWGGSEFFQSVREVYVEGCCWFVFFRLPSSLLLTLRCMFLVLLSLLLFRTVNENFISKIS